jgi:hypothetical protein
VAGLFLALFGCGTSSTGNSTSTVFCQFSEISSYWDVLARSDLVIRARMEAKATQIASEGDMIWRVEAAVLQGTPAEDVTEIAIAGRQICNQFAAYPDSEFSPGREGIFFLVDNWSGDSRGFNEPETRYGLVEHPWAVFYGLDELEAKIAQSSFPIGTAATRRLNEEIGELPLARFTPPDFFDQ